MEKNTPNAAQRVARIVAPALKRAANDQNGQISIFIALIFQILFVFFAMVINIGLVVHDKINLQNAVDLGAYYAAQRQAELLNEIAHINYQIRQDYKLLTWRYRVLGTLGRVGTGNPNTVPPSTSYPPALRPQNFPLSEVKWQNPAYNPNLEVPTVCVANSMWSDMLQNSGQQEDYCYQNYGAGIPPIATTTVIAPWVPLIGMVSAFSQQARNFQNNALAAAGPLNWAFTMQIMYAYKLSIASRKAYLLELRKRLVAPEMRDQAMLPVRTGVLKTIMKNLTTTNEASFDESYFQVINGLSDPACAGPNGSGEPTLPEIRTSPWMIYAMFENTGTNRLMLYYHNQIGGLSPAELNAWDPPPGLMRMISQGEPDPSNLMHSSLGYEKNPWCMAYIGVRAKTKPRKPFAPFGQAIEMSARSFAQPFGGRIGPWYGRTWTPAAPTSSGDRVDPLTSPRVDASGSAGGANSLSLLPNYSRFPGDTLGLSSEIAMGAQRHLFLQLRSMPNNNRLWLRYYAAFDSIPDMGDPLAWDPLGPPNQVAPGVQTIRRAEVAAVAPDLFDATYYSIEPRYFDNYMRLNDTSATPRFPSVQPLQTIGKTPRLQPDIGGRNVQGLLQFSVDGQIGQANGGGLEPNLLASGQLTYAIRDWSHLLTGWAPAGAQLFTFPKDRFGTCSTPAPNSLMIPGKCVKGGRVGYSVRIISRDHLLAPTWNIGGDGSRSKINNTALIDDF